MCPHKHLVEPERVLHRIVEGHLRKTGVERTEGVRKQVEPRGRAGSDPYGTAFCGTMGTNRLGGPFDRPKQLFRLDGKRLAGIRQVKRFADLLEKPNAELLLKLTHLPRNRVLGEEYLLGRPGVIQVPPDGRASSAEMRG